MVTICTNILFVSGIQNQKEMDRIRKIIDEKFECFYTDEGENCMEMGFCSKFSFPESELGELTKIATGSDLAIDAISYDFSISYVAFHRFKDGGWETEFEKKTKT